MRATTGRSNLITTGRALMLLKVNDSNRMPSARALLSMALLPVLFDMPQVSA
jgi:hypothetical protein